MVHDFTSREKLKTAMICPVRDATAEEIKFLDNYVANLECQGYRVHYPPRDTKQEDETGGYRICENNSKEIKASQERIHVYWNKKSKGSLFDLGVAFNEHLTRGLKIKLANRKDVEAMVEESKSPKSFEQVLLKLDDLANLRK